MKGRMYILLAILIIGVISGIGPAAAAELQQKGKSPVYTMDVAVGENGIGTLVVNTEKHTFILNAEGCDPGAQYWLYYMVDASRVFAYDPYPDTYSGRLGTNLGTAVATKDGALHMSNVYSSDVYPNDPMTIDDLSTIAVTKFAAGVYAKEFDYEYVIFPWMIGGTGEFEKVTYQGYNSNGWPMIKQVKEVRPFWWRWPVLGSKPIVEITIEDTAGNMIQVTWYPPETGV